MAKHAIWEAEREAVAMMWGKHYASTYEGSMVGSGAAVFAVWGYVIAKMQPDKDVGAQVELNPKLLAFVIGESEGVISKAIEKLCAPDKNSRTAEKEGRRLVKVGQFAYQVVNGPKYLGLKNLDEKRAGDRERKRKQRSKPVSNGAPLAGEQTYEKILKSEGQEAADAFVDRMAHRPPEADAAPGPCSYCGASDHWRPDCPQIPKDIKAGKMDVPVHPQAGPSPLDLPDAEIPEI